jgi:hypothetical protein
MKFKDDDAAMVREPALGGLQQGRRARIAQRFLSREWALELESFETHRERDRQQAQAIAVHPKRLLRPIGNP